MYIYIAATKLLRFKTDEYFVKKKKKIRPKKTRRESKEGIKMADSGESKKE